MGRTDWIKTSWSATWEMSSCSLATAGGVMALEPKPLQSSADTFLPSDIRVPGVFTTTARRIFPWGLGAPSRRTAGAAADATRLPEKTPTHKPRRETSAPGLLSNAHIVFQFRSTEHLMPTNLVVRSDISAPEDIWDARGILPPSPYLPEIEDPTRFRHCWYLIGPDCFRLEKNQEMGPLLPGMVRIRMLYNGHCESDRNVARGGKHPGQKKMLKNILLGHEPVGEVVAVGPGVEIELGTIVAIEPGLSCGECKRCKMGNYHTCRKVRYLATPDEKLPNLRPDVKEEENFWTEGSYATTMDWPAAQCHVIENGSNPMLAALAESVAACRQARYNMYQQTPQFHSEEDSVLIIGAGQVAIGIMLQLLRKWPNLRIILMARKESDRKFTEELGGGRVSTAALPNSEWMDTKGMRAAIEKSVREHGKGGLPTGLAQRYDELFAAEAANSELLKNLQASFESTAKSHPSIAAVFETTGQSHVMRAVTQARVVRSRGSYGWVSCLYEVSYNEADLRRDDANTFRLRRSANQFPKALRDIHGHEPYYRKIVGRVVRFADIPYLYNQESSHEIGHRIGDGPKVIIKY